MSIQERALGLCTNLNEKTEIVAHPIILARSLWLLRLMFRGLRLRQFFPRMCFWFSCSVVCFTSQPTSSEIALYNLYDHMSPFLFARIALGSPVAAHQQFSFCFSFSRLSAGNLYRFQVQACVPWQGCSQDVLYADSPSQGWRHARMI